MPKKKQTTNPQPFDFTKVKLFVATPCYGGMAHGFYVRALLQLQVYAMQANMSMVVSFLFNESLITRGRNKLADQFMDSDCTHLMWIDSDIAFNPEHLMRMIAADVDVICGVYPKKEINWNSVASAVSRHVAPNDLRHHTGSFVVNLKGYKGAVAVDTNKPVEIFNGGTGFMLVKRQVMEKMARSKKVKKYINDVGDSSGDNSAFGKKITQFFTESIEPGIGRLLSEDYHFCQTWRQMGGKIYVAPWVELAHIGTYMFEGKLMTVPKEQAKDIMKSHGG
jgi:hypothetical protein